MDVEHINFICYLTIFLDGVTKSSQAGYEDYLDQVCKNISLNLEYDKMRTEGQTDACPSNKDGLMFPGYCSDGLIQCDSIKNGCAWDDYPGFYCQGNRGKQEHSRTYGEF